METWRLLVLCLISIFEVSLTKIVLKDNGYEGIVIAINPQIPEDSELIEAIKNSWTDASKYLFLATKNRTYFRNVAILIPETWTNGTYISAIKGESYSKADVLVAEPNPVFGEFPYTLQYGECGKPGQYIHITPNFLKEQEYEFDAGVRGKVITHEWAHLRWGVFDEIATEGYEKFYLQQGSVEATRCPSTLQGLNRVIDYSSGTIEACPLNQNTLLPEPGCVFIPYSPQHKGVYTSMMALQYLESVTGFCHSDHSDPVNQHNTAAPNEHNRLCNLRSTWDVIMDTEDFANGMNPSNPSITDTTPTFEVVQPSPTRYVLVMDVSGSMSGDRIDVMQRAASLFVTEYVANGSYVGLVSFHSISFKLSELRKIDKTSKEDLDQLILGTVANGGTGIGGGILAGLEVLQGSGSCGGNLIVLTDGGENASPFVAEVYDDVLSCNVKMYTIFLDLNSVSVNQIMTNLSVESGGDWFLAYSASTSTDIIDIFRKLSQNDDGDSTKNTYQMHSNAFTLGQNLVESGAVVIDSTVGNDTLFLFTWEISAPDIILESPSGCVYATYFDGGLSYCPDHPIHTKDNTLKAYKLNVPGTAPIGKWIYTIKNSDVYQTFTLTVTSRASNVNILPIEVDATLTSSDITSPVPTVMYAKVTQGFSAVLNANVTGIITTPSSTKVYLQLFDNGAGPDVRKNDGVYSRYFHTYEGQGRYSVQVKVSGNAGSATQTPSGGSPAAFNPGVINDNGTFEANPNGLSNLPNNTVAVNATDEEFERVESGGSFSYSGPDNPGDVYAPNKVTDLSGNQVNITNLDEGVLVEVTFTAPGDDLDSGNASSYEIRYSFANATFILDNFNESILVEENEVVEGNLTSPLEASNVENIVFKVPNNTDNATQEVFIGLRAYDDVGNPSEVSNIRPVTLFYKRSALPVPDVIDTTTVESQTPVPEYSTTDQQYSTTALQPTTATPSEITTETTSARPIAPDYNLLTFQILTGVFGGLMLVLGITTIVLAFKLSSANSKLPKGSHHKSHVNHVYENPYS